MIVEVGEIWIDDEGCKMLIVAIEEKEDGSKLQISHSVEE